MSWQAFDNKKLQQLLSNSNCVTYHFMQSRCMSVARKHSILLWKERIRAERTRERLLQEQQERRRLSCGKSYLSKVAQGDAAVCIGGDAEEREKRSRQVAEALVASRILPTTWLLTLRALERSCVNKR